MQVEGFFPVIILVSMGCGHENSKVELHLCGCSSCSTLTAELGTKFMENAEIYIQGNAVDAKEVATVAGIKGRYKLDPLGKIAQSHGLEGCPSALVTLPSGSQHKYGTSELLMKDGINALRREGSK